MSEISAKEQDKRNKVQRNKDRKTFVRTGRRFIKKWRQLRVHMR